VSLSQPFLRFSDSRTSFYRLKFFNIVQSIVTEKSHASLAVIEAQYYAFIGFFIELRSKNSFS